MAWRFYRELVNSWEVADQSQKNMTAEVTCWPRPVTSHTAAAKSARLTRPVLPPAAQAQLMPPCLQLPDDLNCLERVGQFKRLVDICEMDLDLKNKVRGWIRKLRSSTNVHSFYCHSFH